MRQRLETDVVSNFAHPPIRIKQLGLRPLDSYSAKVLSKGQTRRLLEHFAEIEGADMHRLGNVAQIDRIRLVPNINILPLDATFEIGAENPQPSSKDKGVSKRSPALANGITQEGLRSESGQQTPAESLLTDKRQRTQREVGRNP